MGSNWAWRTSEDERKRRSKRREVYQAHPAEAAKRIWYSSTAIALAFGYYNTHGISLAHLLIDLARAYLGAKPYVWLID